RVTAVLASTVFGTVTATFWWGGGTVRRSFAARVIVAGIRRLVALDGLPLARLGVGRLLGRFARAGVVDPVGIVAAHVQVHEARVRVVADAHVVERAQVVAQRLVRHAGDAEVEGAPRLVLGRCDEA